MILKEKEVLSCLIYICETMFEDNIKILEADLSIDEKVEITGKIIYENQPFDISVSFLLDYKNGKVCLYDIDGKVEYLVFKLNFMNLVKHVLKDYPISYTSDSMSFIINLPIDTIHLKKQNIEFKIK